MCDQCGCGVKERFTVRPLQAQPREPVKIVDASENPAHSHEHRHADGTVHTHVHVHEEGQDHGAAHAHAHEHSELAGGGLRTIPVLQSLLLKNDRLAERNRGFMRGRGLFAVNLLSSPGAGKTTLIEKTIESLSREGRSPVAVIVGDLETAKDASRIRDKGAPVVQITTGTTCHLDAEMVARGLEQLDLSGAKILLLENVGNLVCPAAYDLGEEKRVVLFSTTEGEDKPLKYPPMFKSAHLVLVTKIDLAEAAEFSREAALENLSRVAPQALVLEISAKTGQGMEAWLDFLERRGGAR